MEGTIQAQFVDIRNKSIYPVRLTWAGGKIESLERETHTESRFLLPGFVDAHVHVESSMLVPSEFARLAVRHGTVATVSDPHEIANVLGVAGVEYMLENAGKVPFKFNFGAPSCVPATAFETAGARIDAAGVEALLRRDEIRYLAEMMNYPGVLNGDEEVLAKLAAAKKLGKPADGHAPGLRGEQAVQYIAAGISTDHECFSYEEALYKLQQGMKILIREGSAARNFDALIDLLPQFPNSIMFCSDDKHPDDLLEGHINQLAARAVAHGCDVFDVLLAACINPVEHYALPVGLLQPDDPADFILVDSLTDFKVLETYIGGELVAASGRSLIQRVDVVLINNFNTKAKKVSDFALPAKTDRVRVIRALDGEIVTEKLETKVPLVDGLVQPDLLNDVLKFCVVNRYADAPPAVAFIQGFGLRQGAIASCVGHDSHNILAVGCSDAAICEAINLVIEHQGGIAAVGEGVSAILPLPVAGIMSEADGFEVARRYTKLDQIAKNELGSRLHAPFMTLSFMALPVIPALKLSDLGLFDVEKFAFTGVFVD